MADEASFVIDGDNYEIPDLGSFNMTEAVVLYDHCGLTLEDFAIDEDDPDQVEELAQKTKHPGFIQSLMVVAYMRGNRNVKRLKAEQVIGNSNLIEAYEAMVIAGAAEDPTEPQKSEEPKKASGSKKSSSGGSSGGDSKKSSDEQEETPEPTGTSE